MNIKDMCYIGLFVVISAYVFNLWYNGNVQIGRFVPYGVSSILDTATGTLYEEIELSPDYWRTERQLPNSYK